MDCSSPYAMARLTELKDRFDVAFANDPDADRHGIVTPGAGLLNPNHHLAACIAYLFGGQPRLAVGRRGRQDAGEQQHHRSRGRRPRAPARGGARRLQVVRRRPARRRAGVRRRGERRGCVPAPRRNGLDDRQGRADPLPARGGDDRTRRRRPGPGLPRARRAASATLSTGGSTSRPRRRRRPRSGGCPPSRSAPMSLPASRSSTSRRPRRATARRSEA